MKKKDAIASTKGSTAHNNYGAIATKIKQKQMPKMSTSVITTRTRCNCTKRKR